MRDMYLLRDKDLDCVASRCVADGTEKVGYMYRDEQGTDDSGWRFFSGNEPGWYFMEPDNLPIVSIQEIVELNPDVAELLTESLCRQIHRRKAVSRSSWICRLNRTRQDIHLRGCCSKRWLSVFLYIWPLD